MADAKIEKALYGPSMTEVALGAILGLIAGVLVACVYLVFKPVSQVKEMPPEDKVVKGMVYFIPGNESNAKSRGWQAKQKQILGSPTFTVDLVEDELNAWANTLAAPAAPAPKPGAPAGAAAPAPAGDGIFNPGKPNFKVIAGNKLQISAKCVLNWYGLTKEVTVIATGAFAKSGDTVGFVVDTLHLGSCPVQLLPSLGGPLMAHLIARTKVPDEVRAAWAKLDSVTIDGPKLTFVAQ
ncbi:MAG TPA: hypothetical protein VGD97_12800 [Lacunisphaera sp.]